MYIQHFIAETREHEEQEAKSIKSALKELGYNVIEPGHNCEPHSLSFPDFVRWLKTQLEDIHDQGNCSLLFLNFSGHGFKEHIVYNKKVGFKIKDLLEIIEKAELDIPKVCT